MEETRDLEKEGSGKIVIIARNNFPITSAWNIDGLNMKSISEIVAQLEIIKGKMLKIIEESGK